MNLPDPSPLAVGFDIGPVYSAASAARLANFRDLGGLPTADGRRIRTDLLYRGDASYPGDDAPSAVGQWPPTVVVDLRSADEQQFPFVWPESTSVHTVSLLAALAPALRGLAAPGGTEDLYLHILEQSAAQLAQIVRLVADAPGATLVHCTMGRDRTGVAIAVVLLACGVDGTAILADYEATRPNLRGVLARLRAAGMSVPPDDELPPRALSLNAAAVEAVLARLSCEPGGVIGWLGEHGASEADIERLRDRLVQ